MSRWSGTARGRGTADKICPETVRNQTGTRRTCADLSWRSPAWARRGSRRPAGLGRWRWERRCRRSSWAGAVLAGRTVGPCPAVVGIRVECRRGLRPAGRIRDGALLRVGRDRRLGRRRRVPVSRGRNPGCSEGGSRLRRPNSARVVREERSVRTSVFLTRGGRTWAGRIGTGARFNNRSARVTDARGSRARTAMLITAAYFPNFTLPFGRTPEGTMGTRVGQSKRGWCGRGSSENQPCFLSRGLNFGREDARVVTRRGCGFGGFRVRREPGRGGILTLSTTDQPSAGAGRYHPPLRSGLDGSEARLFR